jgi:hypothetical protein
VTILNCIRQDLFYLYLVNVVIPNVRLTGCRIEVEAKVHQHQYRGCPGAVQAERLGVPSWFV